MSPLSPVFELCSQVPKDGDLEPQTSLYTLTPLKVVYKKLRLLVDLGCIFIGHGLSKDFRIISEPSPSLTYFR